MAKRKQNDSPVFEIGTPVAETPPSSPAFEVWGHVDSLKPGEWLPIHCKDAAFAKNLATQARHRNSPPLEVRKRGNVIYIRPRTRT